MKKLGPLNYYKLKQAVQMTGTFDPAQNLPVFEESLTMPEYDVLKNFLGWLHKHKKTFGSANYEQVFREWRMSKK